jgi:ketosteroid isomerase-like protein
MNFNLVLLIVAMSILTNQTSPQSTKSALQTMFETERAFAQASAEKGTREAFLAFIADDGILFRPTAVKGKEWMLAHPPPASTKRSLLSWQPMFGDMAQSGDMGYTTGPWQFKTDINDEKAAAFGEFITVWKKQRDGSWKFVIDLGVSHAEPTDISTVTPMARTKWKANKPTDAKELLRVDSELAAQTATKGAEAFISETADDVRVFRHTHFPFVGRSRIAKAFPADAAVWNWEPKSADVSAAGDLGYTYGTYTRKDKEALAEKGNYLRIWKRLAGNWRVVMDVADPLAKDTNN